MMSILVNFRKMLTVEQYGSKELSTLYAKRYIDDPLSYQGMVVETLTGVGVLIREEPSIIAMHYYSPIFLLLALCDCQPSREAESMQMIDRHIRLYGKRKIE